MNSSLLIVLLVGGGARCPPEDAEIALLRRLDSVSLSSIGKLYKLLGAPVATLLLLKLEPRIRARLARREPGGAAVDLRMSSKLVGSPQAVALLATPLPGVCCVSGHFNALNRYKKPLQLFRF